MWFNAVELGFLMLFYYRSLIWHFVIKSILQNFRVQHTHFRHCTRQKLAEGIFFPSVTRGAIKPASNTVLSLKLATI